VTEIPVQAIDGPSYMAIQSPTMKQLLRAACVVALLSGAACPQTTETHCHKTNDDIDCTTTDKAAEQKANQEAADNIVGKPITNWRVNRGVKKYCKQHPGEPFHWTMPDGTIARRGVCPAKN
jgi:hypothetical protein